MTSKKYQYLEEYIGPHDHAVKVWQENSFLPVISKDIKEVERKTGIHFPESLKKFWLNIGCGNLTVGKESDKEHEYYHANCILSPEQIADIMLLKDESEFVIPGLSEYFEEGYIKDDDIIFFEIGDMSSFLVMKPNSDKPNAVYDMIGRVIEEDFERFIWRLYHESPDYYLHVYPVPE